MLTLQWLLPSFIEIIEILGLCVHDENILEKNMSYGGILEYSDSKYQY